MYVIKRDGSKVPFNEDKIVNAIDKAFIEVRHKSCIKESIEVAYVVKNKIREDVISVEDIQDIVEKSLMESGYEDIAKSYIRYRYKREMSRNVTDNAILELIKGDSEYWNTENSNKDANVVTTMRDYIAGITSKDLTKRVLLPKEIVEADKKGIIHFHDSDYYIQPL